ncbi:hypothetical protein SODALDRAFT_326833, partial [Sodiomyces alkalinus F11]
MSSEKRSEAGGLAPTSAEQKPISREEDIGRVNTMTADDMDEKKPIEDIGERDYTGVARKADPEEIKIVRKLDWRVMV